MSLTRSIHPIPIGQTPVDRAVANFGNAHASPAPETFGRGLSWGADEHLLLTAAGLVWTYATVTKASWQREASHALITAAVSAGVPHLLKAAFNQTRPDRVMISGHWNGVGFSGNRQDAFPSGHAVHMGAVASAAGRCPEP